MRQMRWAGLGAVIFATFAMAQAAEEKALMQNGASFVSGGVGISSEQRLRARQKEFNLKLVFTLVEGNYVADVGVTVRNASGKTVIEHLADGPLFLAKLPAGAYSVSAVLDGKAQTRKVKLRAKPLRTVYLRWPSKPGRDFVLPREGRR